VGLRERKKAETRRRIADIATGLFMIHGFDRVTVADVARAADVSVNTVFNYFKTKEDLFFDRQREFTERHAAAFRDRLPGESAVMVFRRRFLDGLDQNAYYTGFHEGADVWTKTVFDSPALMARQREMTELAEATLAQALAEDLGADPDDVTPRIAAAMFTAAGNRLIREILQRKAAGESLTEMRQGVYEAANRTFDLLEQGLGDYGAR